MPFSQCVSSVATALQPGARLTFLRARAPEPVPTASKDLVRDDISAVIEANGEQPVTQTVLEHDEQRLFDPR